MLKASFGLRSVGCGTRTVIMTVMREPARDGGGGHGQGHTAPRARRARRRGAARRRGHSRLGTRDTAVCRLVSRWRRWRVVIGSFRFVCSTVILGY